MARFIFYFSLLCLAVVPAFGASNSTAGVPGPETPEDLTRAWLRFHEAELCQGFDAVFDFSSDGLQVQGLVENEKSYQKFEALVAPLRRSHRIEIQAERPPVEEKPKDEAKDRNNDPPASLWENYELRAYLGDPFARAMQREDFADRPGLNTPPPPDAMLKQRLLIYSQQTLEWTGKVERYAKDLPALTRIAADPAMEPRFRAQAKSVGLAHLENMDRNVKKLIDNLSPAFPKSRATPQGSRPEKPEMAGTPAEQAKQLSDYAGQVSLRVHQFIHPEHFTVGLNELRQPGLLDSLQTLRALNSDFRKSLAKVR